MMVSSSICFRACRQSRSLLFADSRASHRLTARGRISVADDISISRGAWILARHGQTSSLMSALAWVRRLNGSGAFAPHLPDFAFTQPFETKIPSAAALARESFCHGSGYRLRATF